MERSLACMTVVAAALFLGSSYEAGSARVDTAELRSAFGGACENCKSNTGACTGATTCTASGAKWEKKTPTDITPQSCEAAAKDKSGFTKCTLSDEQPCYKYQVCTDKNCTQNCADKTLTDAEKKANDKATKCSNTGGKLCQGK